LLAITIQLAQSDGGGSNTLGFLLPLVLMGGIFYFLLIRPQQRQRRRQATLLQSLDVGDEIQTIGGVFGTIREIDDDTVLVEVAPEVEVRFARGAIARKLYFDESEEEEEGEDQGERQNEHEEEEAGDQQ
jgi:preprotein translocase subunit YajC